MLLNEDFHFRRGSLEIIHHNKAMTRFDLHEHVGVECIIPLLGSISLTFPTTQQTYTVKSGQMIIFPPELPHTAVSDERFGERLFLLIERTQLSLERVRLLPRSQLLVELCFELCEAPEMGLASKLEELIYELLRTKICEAEGVVGLGTQSLFNQANDERVKKVLSAFEAELGQGVSFAELAKRAGLSERSMQRLFNAELGMTPGSVLTLFRVERAVQLLRQGESVTQTALLVGYGSLSQFIAQFRKLTGRIPSDFLP